MKLPILAAALASSPLAFALPALTESIFGCTVKFCEDTNMRNCDSQFMGFPQDYYSDGICYPLKPEWNAKISSVHVVQDHCLCYLLRDTCYHLPVDFENSYGPIYGGEKRGVRNKLTDFDNMTYSIACRFTPK